VVKFVYEFLAVSITFVALKFTESGLDIQQYPANTLRHDPRQISLEIQLRTDAMILEAKGL
jgi:hypothetical protein